MKKIILFLLMMVFQFGFSQETTNKASSENVDNKILYKVSDLDVKPEYPGGIDEFYKYIIGNVRTPESKSFEGGIMIVIFTIDVDGTITDIQVKRDLGFGTKEEIVRVLKKCKKWLPGEYSGIPVRCSYTLPITLQGY